MGNALKPGKAFSASNPGVATTAARSDGAVLASYGTFTENGAGTYTFATALPAGAILVDVIVSGIALWTAATSASLEVGDATDPDGIYTAVDLKATDLLAGESISFAHNGGVQGAYFTGTNTHITPRQTAAARTITATVVSAGAGTAGRTNVAVLYIAAAGTAATQA